MTVSFLNKVIAPKVAYQLIVIEEEQVPLAGNPMGENTYFWGTLAVMVAVLAILFTALYLMRCRFYRKRIGELDTDGKITCGWSLRRLKEQLAELEAEKIDENFDEGTS